MRKVLVTTIATLATAMLFTMTTSNAATYKFTFQSNDAELTATGEFTVNAANDVTGVSGAISGLTNQTISGVTANPTFPSASYSPDGSFIFDNLYSPTGMAFDYYGLLFTTAGNPGSYWNLWASSPGAYSLYESAGSYNYPIQEMGSLSVAAAPEPSTWAMLALGFGALTFFGRAASKRLAWRLASAKSFMPSNASGATTRAALFVLRVMLQPR
jgi:PEP-CTERM motif